MKRINSILLAAIVLLTVSSCSKDMMEQVSDYYQSLHRSSIMRLKSLIEPIVIMILALMVGSIILAVIVPMFSMYESVQNLG